MQFQGGIPISQLSSVSVPNNTDVLVLNVNDTLTRKITYGKFLESISFKLVNIPNWNEQNPNSPEYIQNKPCVYECNSYIPSLIEIT